MQGRVRFKRQDQKNSHNNGCKSHFWFLHEFDNWEKNFDSDAHTDFPKG